MPRPKKIEKTVRLEIRLRESVLQEVEQALFSPAHGRVPYEARSRLIDVLLTDWLTRTQGANLPRRVEPDPEELAYNPMTDLEDFAQGCGS